MRVARQTESALGIPSKVIHCIDADAPFEKRPGVDARRSMPLEVDEIPSPRSVLASEEMVESDLVQTGARCVRGKVSPEARILDVGALNHRNGVPANDPPDPLLHQLVPGKRGLLLGPNGVDVVRCNYSHGRSRMPSCRTQYSPEQIPSPIASRCFDDSLK